MTTSENYDELSDRLTGEHPAIGKGKSLWGEEAATSGRNMIATALGIEDLPKEDLDKLFNNSEFIKWIYDADSMRIDRGNNFPEKFLQDSGMKDKSAE